LANQMACTLLIGRSVLPFFSPASTPAQEQTFRNQPQRSSSPSSRQAPETSRLRFPHRKAEIQLQKRSRRAANAPTSQSSWRCPAPHRQS
jgi:hypothetical protein